MEQIISSSGGFAYVVIAFVVALSIIVAIHEYGHYIVGRWCGIHAEVFSLGFGPVIWSRPDKHGTVWQIAALPFGGYVKFLGDANAASVGANEEVAPARNTMFGAPLWARALTVAAGPMFNFILSFFIFWIFASQVMTPLTISETKLLPEIYTQELEVGDQVLSIAGQDVPEFSEFGGFLDGLPAEPELDYVVLRDGQEITLSAPYPQMAIASSISMHSAAEAAGVEVGDVISAVDGDPIFSFGQLVEKVQGAGGAAVKLDVWRAGEMIEFELTPRVTTEQLADGSFVTNMRIGIAGQMFFDPETEHVGFGAGASAAIERVWDIITGSLRGLWAMLTGAISACNLSGPIGIAQASGAMASQGALSFIGFVALLSTAVGLLNLFPIPVLDGGHLVFHAYEAVRGKPPSDLALRILMTIGLGLILTLMIVGTGSDIICRLLA